MRHLQTQYSSKTLSYTQHTNSMSTHFCRAECWVSACSLCRDSFSRRECATESCAFRSFNCPSLSISWPRILSNSPSPRSARCFCALPATPRQHVTHTHSSKQLSHTTVHSHSSQYIGHTQSLITTAGQKGTHNGTQNQTSTPVKFHCVKMTHKS